MTKWRVWLPDDPLSKGLGGGPGQWYDRFCDVPECVRKSLSVPPTAFRPGNNEDGDTDSEQLSHKLHLDRAWRILPHHQDSGGFFVASLRRIAHGPSGNAHRSPMVRPVGLSKPSRKARKRMRRTAEGGTLSGSIGCYAYSSISSDDLRIAAALQFYGFSRMC